MYIRNLEPLEISSRAPLRTHSLLREEKSRHEDDDGSCRSEADIDIEPDTEASLDLDNVDKDSSIRDLRIAESSSIERDVLADTSTDQRANSCARRLISLAPYPPSRSSCPLFDE